MQVQPFLPQTDRPATNAPTERSANFGPEMRAAEKRTENRAESRTENRSGSQAENRPVNRSEAPRTRRDAATAPDRARAGAERAGTERAEDAKSTGSKASAEQHAAPAENRQEPRTETRVSANAAEAATANPSTGAAVPANEMALEAVAHLIQVQVQVQVQVEAPVSQAAVMPHPVLAALMQSAPAHDDGTGSDEADPAAGAPDSPPADALAETPATLAEPLPIEPEVAEQPAAPNAAGEPTGEIAEITAPEPNAAAAPPPPPQPAAPIAEQEIPSMPDTVVMADDDGGAPQPTAAVRQPETSADDPPDTEASRGAVIPPGISNAKERSSGAPFQSRMPATAKPAQPALNHAPAFATDVQPGQQAMSSGQAAPESLDPDMAETADVADMAEVPEPDVEEALDFAKRTMAADADRDPGRIVQRADARTAPTQGAAAASAQPQPITPEGGFQPGLDGRGIATQQTSEALGVGAGSAAKQAAARSYGANVAQPATQQVAIGISRAMQEGADRLTVQLKPTAMGRISIELEVGHDNRVIAVIAAERADTFELLQRDAKALERALNEAGLKTDNGSLSFDLRGEGRERDRGESEPPTTAGSIALPEDIPAEAAADMNAFADGSAPGRLNIRI